MKRNVIYGKIFLTLLQGVPEWLKQSRTLVLGLGASVGDKSYGKIHLIPIHFDFRFWKCQNIEFCLLNSSVVKFVKYWIYIGIVFLVTVMILFLLSFLGILSVWSEIWQKDGKCANGKNLCCKNSRKFNSKFKEWQNLAFFLHRFFSLVHFPSFCKISDQTDKMPRNESKNKIIMVNKNTFPL